ncbi:MAG: type II secretion system GspH family protein [Candidatus Gracilibacteria bacterium]|nr:type II secretion system GspH family protein [Candidatus Gracilibacteria bacterium]
MHKTFGFSFLEIVVGIALIGTLAAVAYPSLAQWQRKEAYLRETSRVIETLTAARANALSERVCPSGEAAETWTAKVQQQQRRLFCNANPATTENTVMFSHVNVFLYSYNDVLSEWTLEAIDLESRPLEIVFSTEENTPPVIQVDDGAITYSEIQLVLEPRQENIRSKKLCFNRFGGFPFWDQDGKCGK